MPTKTLFAALLVGLLSSVLASARMQHESPHSRFAKRVETQTPITKPKIAGWLVGWGGDLHSGLYKKYEELSFAFALTDRLADPGINTTVDNIPQLLPNATKLVDDAGAHRLVSIGGWTGSQYFSLRVRDAAAREKFVGQVVKLVVDGTYDGVDLDWEFPNGKPDNASHVTGDLGPICNENHPDDYSNFISFIVLLRERLTASLGKPPILAAAVPFSGFFNSAKQYVTDASALVAPNALDYITIMAYEMASHYRKDTGLQSPLNLPASAPLDQQMSIVKSVDGWIKAGVPKDRIQLGLTASGKIMFPKKDEMSNLINTISTNKWGKVPYIPQDPPTVQKENPLGYDPKTLWGQGWRKWWELDICGDFRKLPQETLNCGECKEGQAGGPVTYLSLLQSGVIDADGRHNDGKHTELVGGFDETAQSPWIINKTSGAFYTYENARSMRAKSSWAKQKGLLGVKLFAVQQDSINGTLITAIKEPWAL
ncbi:glycoside hydrolase family 18 protein [Cystobasidium minutum MCA 4210]|uniref:glycoside hydrolase family 18 protein n=1 Tax=Cystobasidium minutum MCA 4210 TaxID=1397322 RepID=UPI0034CE7B9C|eukprot:jgi/Rhomi1/196313/gm1.4527_g